MSEVKEEYVTASPEETIKLGVDFGKGLAENAVVCFFGDLAAGKTTFIKGLAAGVTHCSFEEVNSPTFVYLNIYEGPKTVYHFDLYRLSTSGEFLSLGLDEFLSAGGISCIEWSERIESLLPAGVIRVEMSHHGENKRHIAIKRST